MQINTKSKNSEKNDYESYLIQNETLSSNIKSSENKKKLLNIVKQTKDVVFQHF